MTPPAHRDTGSGLPSFWMGGYEGADHVNAAGEALDMVAATGHDQRLAADYRAARRLGLRCVRESIGWRLTERADGSFDFSRAIRMAETAQQQSLQVLWTLMHYGVPPDLTLLDDRLIPRFARFCAEAARVLRPLCPGPRFYTPINEISYLAWVASATHDMGPAGVQTALGAEDSGFSGYQLKQRLVRAALAGMQAIRAVDPEARFLHVEPVLHVAPQDGSDPEQAALAERIASYQWQTLDMLAGRQDPELGGHLEALDWLGLNHYHSSQWEVPSEKRLPWHLRDPRRQPLSALLAQVWQRYDRPLLVAETGHIGVGRADWLHEIAGEARRALALGLPLQGVCLYPLLDRPDWNETWRWHRSGLWHLASPTQRRLHRPLARALSAWQDLAPTTNAAAAAPPPPGQPGLLVLLPCPWNDWPAPREPLLQALRGRPVRLLEPPRVLPTGEPLLRTHSLSLDADLWVLHATGAQGWAAPPTPAQLALLQTALPQAGLQRPACWLASWPASGHPAWWRELAGTGLLVQHDPATPPDADLLQLAHAQLPPWPPAPRADERPPQADSYEADEVARLLHGLPTPRTWCVAPAVVDARCAEALCNLACAQPGMQWLVDASAPDTEVIPPPNLHWLGRLHESLHPALAAAVQQVRRWDNVSGWPGEKASAGGGDAASGRQVEDLVEAVRQALARAYAGSPEQR